jgi:hypothetical protein
MAMRLSDKLTQKITEEVVRWTVLPDHLIVALGHAPLGIA